MSYIGRRKIYLPQTIRQHSFWPLLSLQDSFPPFFLPHSFLLSFPNLQNLNVPITLRSLGIKTNCSTAQCQFGFIVFFIKGFVFWNLPPHQKLQLQFPLGKLKGWIFSLCSNWDHKPLTGVWWRFLCSISFISWSKSPMRKDCGGACVLGSRRNSDTS